MFQLIASYCNIGKGWFPLNHDYIIGIGNIIKVKKSLPQQNNSIPVNLLNGQMSTHRNGNDDEITRSSLNPRQIAVTRVEWRPVSSKVCVYVCVCVYVVRSSFLFGWLCLEYISWDFIDSASRDWKPNRTELRRYYVNCLRWEIRIHSPPLMITGSSFTGSDGRLSGLRELLREYDNHLFCWKNIFMNGRNRWRIKYLHGLHHFFFSVDS